MRIAFVTFEYPPFLIGGAGVYAEKLTYELVKLGHEVIVFTPKASRKTTDILSHPEIVEIEVKNGSPLTSVQFWLNLPEKMRFAHNQKAFDIVHVNGLSYWPIHDKIINVPHLITIHHLAKDAISLDLGARSILSNLFGESSILYRLMEKKCVKNSDSIIAVSNFTKERVIETYNYPIDKIVVVYNGIESHQHTLKPDFVSKFKDKYKLDSRPVVLFVGRIDDPRKGLELLLEAFHIVINKIKAQLLIVGNGDEKKIVKKIKELGVEDSVIITGYLEQSELDCCYSLCDVYACPSLMEGFGLTIAEASSYGKRVVAFKVGAIPEVVDNTAILVKEIEKETFALAITEALTTPFILNPENNTHNLVQSWSNSALESITAYQNLIDSTK